MLNKMLDFIGLCCNAEPKCKKKGVPPLRVRAREEAVENSAGLNFQSGTLTGMESLKDILEILDMINDIITIYSFIRQKKSRRCGRDGCDNDSRLTT